MWVSQRSRRCVATEARDNQLDKELIPVVTREIAVVRIGQIRLDVQPDRYQATAPASASAELKELTRGILRVLEHVPVTAVGMNRHMHFKAASDELWHRVGHTLVPKDIWAEFLDEPGTQTVSVKGTRKGASSAGHLTVIVQPSVQVRPGVFVSTNEHRDVGGRLASDANAFFDEWDAVQSHARVMAESLLKRCNP